MTVEVDFPHHKLAAAQVMFHPTLMTRSGGPTVTGAEQVVASSSGRWGATLSFEVGHGVGMIDAAARDADSVLAWRAVLALLEGRTNILLIGPYDKYNAPAAIAGTAYGGRTLHSDDMTFNDASQYQQGETPARVAAAYAVGATSVTVDMLAGHSPEPGQYFSILDRLFLIKSAVLSTTVADRWALGVWPPARVAITAAQVAAHLHAEFDEPRCKMRMAQDSTGQLALRQLYRSSPTFELVEATA